MASSILVRLVVSASGDLLLCARVLLVIVFSFAKYRVDSQGAALKVDLLASFNFRYM